MSAPSDPPLSTLAALSRVSFFAGMATDQLQDLAKRIRRRRYAKGDTIFLRGDPGNSLYIIEVGSVKIALSSTDGKEIMLALLSAGDFFGELALLDGEPRSADAVTLEPTQALLLQREDFLHFVQDRPGVAQHLLMVLSHRLRLDTQLVEDAAFLDVPARLARAILQLAEDQGQQDADGVVIHARFTQTQLASMVGASRESVNKWLGFYERQGLIRRDKGRIIVIRPEGLQRRIY